MITLVDANNSIMMVFSMWVREMQKTHGMEYEASQKDLPLFYHMLTKKIVSILSTYRNVIFCFDSPTGKLWRRSIYPAYKANRKKNSFLNEEFFSGIRDFIQMFQVKLFVVDGAEADDLIYKICELEMYENEIVVISSDGDFIQLMNYFPVVKVYNPIKKDFMKPNPNILMEKSMIGDPADGIAGLRGVGPKTLQKMLNDKVYWNKVMTMDNVKLQEKLLQIIDLRKCDKGIQDKIEEEYKKLVENKFNKDEVEAFFLKYGMKECLNDWGRMSSQIQLRLSDNHNDVDIDDILKGVEDGSQS